jgi:uncharacterized protein YegP (UPF0339 family)
MKKEYDFSKAEKAKFYSGNKSSEIIVHLQKNPNHPRFEVFLYKPGEYKFRLRDDGHVIFTSEGFSTQDSCLEAISELKQNSLVAPTVIAN